MGRVEGKVAVVTGVARDQGRAHAVPLAEEDADIVAMWLPSDEARYVTGVALPVDAGALLK